MNHLRTDGIGLTAQVKVVKSSWPIVYPKWPVYGRGFRPKIFRSMEELHWGRV